MSRQLTDAERDFTQNYAILSAVILALQGTQEAAEIGELCPISLRHRIVEEDARIIVSKDDLTAAEAESRAAIKDTLLSLAAGAVAAIEDYFGEVDSDGS